MSQSLYTAMGGISAAQTDLNVISNNIANLNTTAFKTSSVNFSDVFYTTISSGTGASNSTGGTNPMQVGLGVQVSSVSKNFSSGTWVATGKTTDMMIQGSGFFTVQSSGGEVFYTRAGDFSFDSDGDLVTSEGYKVLGTDKVLFATASTVPVHIPQKIVTDVLANDDYYLKNLKDLNACQLTDGKFNMHINGATTAIPITVDTDTYTTMNALVANINSQLVAAGVPAADLTLSASAANGCLQFQMDGVDVTSISFDNPSVGASNFLSQTGFGTVTKSGNNYTSNILDWKADVREVTSISDAVTLSSYSIGDDGSIEATYSNGDSLSVRVGSDNNTYEFIYTTAENVEIKGADVYVNPNVAQPANFVIQLANITNNDGLIATGSNLYAAGPNSGNIIYSVGDAMGLGSIASGGLEASNVDLSSEFSGMILAQRAVQANSRVFSTTSEIMDVIVNMAR